MNNTITTKDTVCTGNIGWSGAKRHIIRITENANGNIVGRPRAACSDAIRWNGTQQPTRLKKEMPSLSNVTCEKCRALI